MFFFSKIIIIYNKDHKDGGRGRQLGALMKNLNDLLFFARQRIWVRLGLKILYGTHLGITVIKRPKKKKKVIHYY